MARSLAAEDVAAAGRLFDSLAEPFAVHVLDEERKRTFLYVGSVRGPKFAAEALRQFEPHVLWEENFLRNRLATYEAIGDPQAGRAARDLKAFLAVEP